MSQTDTPRLRLLRKELAHHWLAIAQGDARASWRALERAHILAQPTLRDHLRVHLIMLRHALRTQDPGEAIGQMLRILLAPLGALTGRIPSGNTGGSNISAFMPMPIPSDLAGALAVDER